MLNRPLPPATPVYVTGVHPEAPQWKAITVLLDLPYSGFVQGFRVNEDLPEPRARLHLLTSTDTAEGFARQAFAESVEDGMDYRFYENVLLYVNRRATIKSPRGGISGTYQDPNILGGGSNNIQLMAGRCIWLVSPEYAITLRGKVPSGSLTGGMVAKARRFGQRLADIGVSIDLVPEHLAEVAGEVLHAMLEHLPEIIATTALFVAGEMLSTALAGSVVGAPIAVLIQLLLALWGATFVYDAFKAAIQHGIRWLTLAWNAHGDMKQLHEASRELVRMFAALIGGVLALIGVKASLGRAASIGGKALVARAASQSAKEAAAQAAREAAAKQAAEEAAAQAAKEAAAKEAADEAAGQAAKEAADDAAARRTTDETAAQKPAKDPATHSAPATLNVAKQGKHTPGHPNFIEGRSELTANPNELATRAGTGTPTGATPRGQAGFKERIDFGKEIGTYVDAAGQRSPTSVGILHYDGNNTYHIVPARPNGH